jgi:hypothetical protein
MNPRALAAGALALAVGFVTTGEVRAQTGIGVDIGADLDAAIPIASDQLAVGAGFDARAGLRIAIGPLSITPELAAGAVFMGTRVIRLRPGLRVGIGERIVPALYGHVGYGWTRYYSASGGGGGGFTDRPQGGYLIAGGLALDAGAALDIHPMDAFSVGAHVGYTVVKAGHPGTSRLDFASEWMNPGVHATLHF